MLLAGWLLGAGLAFGLSPPPAGVTVETLRCEYLDNPLGIDTPQPRLSWVLESKAAGAEADRVSGARGEQRGPAEGGHRRPLGHGDGDVRPNAAGGLCGQGAAFLPAMLLESARVGQGRQGLAPIASRLAGKWACCPRRIGRASGSAALPTPIPCPLPCSAARSRSRARSSKPALTFAGLAIMSFTSMARRSATTCSTPATPAMTNARSTSLTMSPTPCAAGRMRSA